MRDQGLAYTRRVDAHAAADPGIHPDEPLGFDLLDVDSIRPIENGEMASQVGLLHQVTHDGQRHFPDVNADERTATQAQDL